MAITESAEDVFDLVSPRATFDSSLGGVGSMRTTPTGEVG